MAQSMLDGRVEVGGTLIWGRCMLRVAGMSACCPPAPPLSLPLHGCHSPALAAGGGVRFFPPGAAAVWAVSGSAAGAGAGGDDHEPHTAANAGATA